MSWLWGKKDQEIEKENLVVREDKENDSHAAIIEASQENSPSNSNKNQDDDKHELRSRDHIIDVTISDASFNENNASSYESSENDNSHDDDCLLYTSPSPRDKCRSRMPSSA